jgi:hypothetical protein
VIFYTVIQIRPFNIATAVTSLLLVTNVDSNNLWIFMPGLPGLLGSSTVEVKRPDLPGDYAYLVGRTQDDFDLRIAAKKKKLKRRLLR